VFLGVVKDNITAKRVNQSKAVKGLRYQKKPKLKNTNSKYFLPKMCRSKDNVQVFLGLDIFGRKYFGNGCY